MLNFCVYGCAGPGVAVLVAVRLPYAGMDFPTYHIRTFFCFVLTWHPAIPPYDSGTFYDVPDYSRQRPDYSHYSAMDYLTLCQLCSLLSVTHRSVSVLWTSHALFLYAYSSSSPVVYKEDSAGLCSSVVLSQTEE